MSRSERKARATGRKLEIKVICATVVEATVKDGGSLVEAAEAINVALHPLLLEEPQQAALIRGAAREFMSDLCDHLESRAAGEKEE